MNLDDVVTAVLGGAEPRAGGTDVMARHHIGLAGGPFADLPADLRGVTRESDGSTRVGALTTIAELAEAAAAYPALASCARALATPQIRAAATVGGNLLQRNRCWYYRNPAFSCHQKGGDGCPARSGDNRFCAVVDTGPCVAVHPSSLAVALLAYDAVVEVHVSGAPRAPGAPTGPTAPAASTVRPIADLYGDGSDPGCDHLLAPGDILTAVRLPPPVAGERAAHHRVTGRVDGEWPLAEAVARVTTDGTRVVSAVVAVGAVARTPLRLRPVEEALAGVEATPEAPARAADRAMDGCTALSGNAYKIGLLRDTVLEVLERALR